MTADALSSDSGFSARGYTEPVSPLHVLVWPETKRALLCSDPESSRRGGIHLMLFCGNRERTVFSTVSRTEPGVLIAELYSDRLEPHIPTSTVPKMW